MLPSNWQEWRHVQPHAPGVAAAQRGAASQADYYYTTGKLDRRGQANIRRERRILQLMNHASLFSGIGGFDLAAEWMGWNNVFNCEWEEFPRQVLKHHFPNAIKHGDITELDATAYAGRIDILTGGFPCQPYSAAGKRKGKDDERHLWPEMLRVIQECAPRYVVGENVFGLVNWNRGMVF